MPFTVGVYTLGCKVNQYESEAIAEAFEREGFDVCDPSERCDVYVINTCTVTAESDRKSKQFIRRAMSENPNAKIIVTGCLAQVAPEKVAAIDGVAYVCGSRNKMSCVTAAKKLVGSDTFETVIDVKATDSLPFECMSIKKFPRTRAYIKIEDGCESHCTYCIIPQARGKICSKSPRDVLREIEALAIDGCREVVLTGIETASYGIDFENYRLCDLLRDADELVKGKVRIRLGSLDPSLMKPKFIEKIAPLTSLAPHFHLSMQSGSDRILAKMKRKYNTKMAYDGISLLREAIPDVQFTTDIITAFPSESDEDFELTREFLQKAEFLNAHIFTYSRRNGTLAASMPDQVAAAVGKARTSSLIACQKEITQRILEANVGKEFPVLFETHADGFSVGHTPSFIEVKVKCDKDLHSELCNVKIISSSDGYAEGIII